MVPEARGEHLELHYNFLGNTAYHSDFNSNPGSQPGRWTGGQR